MEEETILNKDKTRKIVFNTIVLYMKILLNMLISLVTVPIVLRALGKSDYGLYNLIAGIITMLAFLNSSMAITTQRYCSVAIGEGNIHKLNQIFNVSLILHFAIAVIVLVIFEIVGFFVFEGFLNIPESRVGVAKIIYQFLVISTFFTILAVPYNAIMNAKEDMLAFSIIGIVEALLKLSLAVILLYLQSDRLIIYGLGIAILTVIITFVTKAYIHYKYRDFKIDFKKYYSKSLMKEISGFASWNTLGSIAMIGRNQGIAIIMNVFYGTMVNAAYGIANQVNGVLNYFSSTFQKVLNPQLMQSEGENNRTRLIKLSIISSKLSFMVLAMIAVPLIIEMPYILKLWLKDVPDFTLHFCRLILVLSLLFQYSMGLMSSIQAVGNIKKYFIIISVLILLNLPISYYMLYVGLSPHYCIALFIIIEFLSFIYRLQYASVHVGIKKLMFFKEVIWPTIICIIIPMIFVWPIEYFVDVSFSRMVIVVLLYIIIYCICAWKIALTKDQRQNIVKKII